MDLIYADSTGVDIGVLQKYSLDWEASTAAELNTFAVDVYLKDDPLDIKYYLYIEGDEIGGVLDSVKIDTARSMATYSGRTWRGMLTSKILSPDAGTDYLVVSGDANVIIGQLITRVGMQDLFQAANVPSNINISNYQFYRYVDMYSGINKMLSDAGAKFKARWTNGKVEISAVPIVEYSNSSEISSDMFDFKIQQSQAGANHIIGLGRGELRNREVVHRYINGSGQISNSQYYFGPAEIVTTYENSNCESLNDLIISTEERLLELADESKVEITANNINADIGDVFTAHDIYSGLVVSQKVTDKIAKISNNFIKYSYKVGDVK